MCAREKNEPKKIRKRASGAEARDREAIRNKHARAEWKGASWRVAAEGVRKKFELTRDIIKRRGISRSLALIILSAPTLRNTCPV